MGVVTTAWGGSIGHTTKKLHLIVDNSAMTEGIATSRAIDGVEMGREVMRGLGEPVEGPTFVGTDNKANQAVASGEGAATRMRHCLRRYLSTLQRVERGVAVIGHVAGDDMPADYLTKLVDKNKLNRSEEWLCNHRNAVPPQ